MSSVYYSSHVSRDDRIVDTPEEKIGRRIVPQPNGCWLYRNDPDRYGHATISDGTSYNVAVHRFVYETLVGQIPNGHHLHHKCQTRGCCNPKHLVPLTPREHMLEHDRLRAS